MVKIFFGNFKLNLLHEFALTQAWTYTFLKSKQMSIRNDIASDNVNFILDPRLFFFFFLKVVCVTVWGYCTLVNIKLR